MLANISIISGIRKDSIVSLWLDGADFPGRPFPVSNGKKFVLCTERALCMDNDLNISALV